MNRKSIHEGLVVKIWPVGEIHSGVLLLTADLGLLSCIAHGARSAKGHLRTVCRPLYRGLVSVYHDPVRSSWKIEDFDARFSFDSIQQNMAKYACACFALDIMAQVPVHGDWEYTLLLVFLESINALGSSYTLACTVQFVERVMLHTGIQPPALVGASSDARFLRTYEQRTLFSPEFEHYLRHTRELSFIDASCYPADLSSLWEYLTRSMEFLCTQFDMQIKSWPVLVNIAHAELIQ